MSRAMTSKGRQRARRFAMAPVLAALLFALLFPGGAQAMIPLIQGSGASTWTASGVQANGVFELDADSTATPTPSPTRTDNTTPGLPDDWDRVCHTVSPTLCPLATNDHASARSFDSEVNADGTANNASIFTGGGSKD